ncbi:MAG: hypothetical protein Q8R82_14250 [Hyphomonadaceae bacterium]|nr:hypothetical protein [Hyphomonadaceae bacterium]
MEQSEFTFKYTGTSEIDVNLLISSLQNITNAIQDISIDSIGTPIEVKIKPFHEGSFEWIFALKESGIIGAVPLLLDAISGDGIIEKFKTVVEIVKFFKGNTVTPPRQLPNNNFEFKNESGDVKIVQGDSIGNVFNNGGNATVYNVETLYLIAGNSESIDGFEMLDKNKKKILKVDKEELKITRANIDRRITDTKAVVPNKRTVPKKNVTVFTAKPDLLGKSAWKVIYEGNTIDAKVTDAKFQKDVNDGLHMFKGGTPLEVDLEITQVLDSATKVYKNQSYNITKFHSFTEPNEQTDLFAG